VRRHSLIFRLGQGDTQSMAWVEPTAVHTEIPLTDLTSRLAHGIGDTLDEVERLGLAPTELAIDLLVIASAVYAADKRINRTSEAQDSWTREIDLHLPVSEPLQWSNRAAHLRHMLQFLTGDLWRVFFRPRPNEFQRLAQSSEQLPALLPTAVCLFSGGLDSFIGAIDLFESGESPLLVSHGWVANDSKHQGVCLNALRQHYNADRVKQLRSRIGFEEGLVPDNAPERTERSRSFLFIALAALAASGMQPNTTIYVPENALIALNVPLDPLRLGAFSTRTTHPYFLTRFNELLAYCQISAGLLNLYRHKTKGEMVAECRNLALLREHVADTTSCSSANKARWKGAAPGHCGHCVPCIIRRAALLRLNGPDPTHYTLADLKAHPLNSTRAEGEDIRSFQLAIRRLNNNIQRAHVLIHESGPLTDYADEIESYAQVYLRGMQEVGELLNGVATVPYG
jgi:hypothetical protein